VRDAPRFPWPGKRVFCFRHIASARAKPSHLSPQRRGEGEGEGRLSRCVQFGGGGGGGSSVSSPLVSSAGGGGSSSFGCSCVVVAAVSVAGAGSGVGRGFWICGWAGCATGDEAEVIGGGSAFGSNAKAVVVSALAPVIGGSVSPGPWIVDVTPAAEPSSTVSYSCCAAPRAPFLPPHAARISTNTREKISLLFIGARRAARSQAACHAGRESIFRRLSIPYQHGTVSRSC